MIAPELISAFRFFHEHGGQIVGRQAEYALALARAEIRAKEIGLDKCLEWEEDPEPWDADCPAPKLLVMAAVWRNPNRRGGCLTSLGSIGLESWKDPYVRVVTAELYLEALGILDGEKEALAEEQANALAARPSYAMGVA